MQVTRTYDYLTNQQRRTFKLLPSLRTEEFKFPTSSAPLRIRDMDLWFLPIQSQYIYSILLFVTKHKDQFLSNSQIHKINTRQTFDLYVPTANLTVYQKGIYYSGIKIYNHLPTTIKDLSDDKNKFKLTLKRYLLHNSFYSLEEYFNT